MSQSYKSCALLIFLLFCSCSQNSVDIKKSATNGATDEKTVQAKGSEKDEIEADLASFTPSLVASHAASINELLADTKLEIPDVWLDLPDWLPATDLPFDTNEYFPIEYSNNGALSYLRAIARSSFNDALLFLPECRSQLDNKESNEVLAAFDESRLIGKARYRLLDWVYDFESDLDWELFNENAPVFVTHLKPVLEDLRKAQTFQKTIIPANFALDELGPSQSYRTLAYDLSILCIASESDEEAIDAIDLTLRMEQDFRILGGESTQLVCSSIVRHALNYQVQSILNRCEDSQQIQKVIDLLEHAHRSEIQSSRIIEMARFEHLQLRKLLHELQNDTFQADPETLEYLSMPTDLPPITVAHQLMTFDFLGGYAANETVAIEAIKESFGDDSDVVAKTKEAIAESKKSPIARSAAGPIILPKVMASFEAMDDEDFEFEVKILKQRYADIEKALSLAYPERIDALATLRQQWTDSDEWRKTKFLKWYLPRRYMGKLSPRLRQILDARLSLACVRKFQLEHQGRLPKNVVDALEFAGVKETAKVIDPYSGKPFKLIAESDRVGIYSIGPDRKDNQGKPELSPSSFRSDDEGDVVFWLK